MGPPDRTLEHPLFVERQLIVKHDSLAVSDLSDLDGALEGVANLAVVGAGHRLSRSRSTSKKRRRCRQAGDTTR